MIDTQAANNMASGETYPLNIDYLPNEYCEKAEKELKELPEHCTHLLEELKVKAKSKYFFNFRKFSNINTIPMATFLMH